MLKAFRDNLKYLSWVLWLVIIAFILVAFVGLGDLGPGGASADVAATVGSQKVTYREFESAYRRTEDFYRQAYGERFNADFAKQLGLHQQVLDTLVADRILLIEADRMGLEVTNAQLQAAILELPVFQNEDGSFIGAGDYARILRQNGYTQAGFEAGLRQDLLLDRVRKLVAENLYIPEGDVEREYRQRTERAKIRFFKAPYQKIADEPQFDEAQLVSYYEENRESFETPERRVAEYLVVDVERIRESLEIAPEEVRAYYDGNSDEFDQPEQIRARHILLQVNDKRSADEARSMLETAKQRIESGASFADVAAELSEDPGSKDRGGDLGFFGRGAMVEAFETAAFATPAGQMTGPIQTDFGLHLIEVLERQEGGLRPFEDVQANIRQRLALERSNVLAEEKAAEISGRLGSSNLELATVAESETAVTFQATPPFAESENVPSIGRSTPFAAAAFELGAGETSAPLRIPKGWAILRVAEIQEPRVPPIDEVREQAESRLRAELVRRAAIERLTRDRNKGLDAIAEAIDAPIEESESFGENGPGGTLAGQSGEIAAAALAAEEGDIVGPIASEDGAILFEVVERVKVDPQVFAVEKAATRDALVSQRAGQLVASLVAERRKELEVSFDPQLLATFELNTAGPEAG